MKYLDRYVHGTFKNKKNNTKSIKFKTQWK